MNKPGPEWQLVVFSAECDEDGNCPFCGIDYGDCPCPGPTQDGYEYQEFDGVLYARVCDTCKGAGNIEIDDGTDRIVATKRCPKCGGGDAD
jgi:hypothetical protein